MDHAIIELFKFSESGVFCIKELQYHLNFENASENNVRLSYFSCNQLETPVFVYNFTLPGSRVGRHSQDHEDQCNENQGNNHSLVYFQKYPLHPFPKKDEEDFYDFLLHDLEQEGNTFKSRVR